MPSFYDNLKKVLTEMDRMNEFNELISNYVNQSDQKEVYVHPLDIKNDCAYLIPLADLHVGNVNFNIDKLIAFANYILDTPDTYTILLGDQMECATRTSIGLGQFSEDMHIREQLDLVYEIFKPIAEAKKLWGIHIGNHEYRIPKEVGLSPAEILARRLEVPYLGYQGYHLIKVRNKEKNLSQNYKIMSFHGSGSGTTMGALINAAERGERVCGNADLFISGHTHVKNMHSKTIYNIDDNGSLLPQNRYYVICGSFLEYWGSYAEMKLLTPHATGAVVISLSAKEKDIKVSL